MIDLLGYLLLAMLTAAGLAVLVSVGYYLKFHSASGHIRCELGHHRWTYVKPVAFIGVIDQCILCGINRKRMW